MASESILDIQAFKRALIEELRLGNTVVPLVGSGLSAASGIPVGRDFEDYFLYVIWLCLVCRDSRSESKLWNLQTMGWPPNPSDNQVKRARTEIAENHGEIRSAIEKGTRLDPDKIIIQEGIGVLADWRSTLIFLSRVKLNEGEHSFHLAAPDLRVIDSFNLHITRNRKSNLGHKMLAHLSIPFGMRVVLTTNFDSLIEEAYANLRNPLSVFDVSITGKLPDHELVGTQNSIIKLHGGLFETRADHSLDEDPTDVDKKNFSNYLGSTVGTAPVSHSHLLILGFSGRDNRIMQLIRHAISQDGRKTKLFWVCHSADEVSRIKKLLPNDRALIHVVHTSRTDLLLYELFQDITYALPPGGLTYRFVYYLPPDVLGNVCREADGYSEFRDGIVTAVLEKSDVGRFGIEIVNNTHRSDHGHLVIVRGEGGVSSVAADAFHVLSKTGKRCLWFELSDFTSPEELSIQIFTGISRQLGRFEHDPITFPIDCSDLSEMLTHMEVTATSWVLFLYGRDVPGLTAGWGNHLWCRPEYENLKKILLNLAEAGFTVVYMPFTSLRQKRLLKILAPFLDNTRNKRSCIELELQSDRIDNVNNHKRTPGAPTMLSSRTEFVFQSAIKWVRTAKIPESTPDQALYSDPVDEDIISFDATDDVSIHTRAVFLYAVTLFRHSRYPSSLFSEATFQCPHQYNLHNKDNDEIRGKVVKRWVEQLILIGLIRRKPGGYYWLHYSLRSLIREFLENEVDYPLCPDDVIPAIIPPSCKRSMLGIRSRTHHWIAEWYLKAFRASNHPNPLMESLYHRYQALCYVHDLQIPSIYKNEKDQGIESKEYRKQFGELTLMEMSKTLRMARPSIKFWFRQEVASSLFEPPEGVDEIVKFSVRCDHAWSDVKREFKRINSLILEVSGTAFTNLLEYDEPRQHRWKNRKTQHEAASTVDPRERNHSATIEAIMAKCAALVEIEAKSKLLDKDAKPSELRRDLIIWLRKRRSRQEVYLLIQALSTTMRLQFQRAKLDESNPATIDFLAPTAETANPHNWTRISGLNHCIVRLAWNLDRAMIGAQDRVNIDSLGMYAVALAYLNRFSEASRRLNEAIGYLSKSGYAIDEAEWALLELRRAEVSLLESTSVVTKDGAARLSHLNTAWCALEKSERLLTGNNRSVWWWGRLYVLQLRVLSNLTLLRGQFESSQAMAYRIKTDHRYRIERVLRRGILLRPINLLRTSRLYHYFIIATGDNETKRAILDNFQDPRQKFGDLIGTYEDEFDILTGEIETLEWECLNDPQKLLVYARFIFDSL